MADTKSSTFPPVRRVRAHGYEKRENDVVFCGSEAQQHVIFFPGDVQVRLCDSKRFFIFITIHIRVLKNL